MLAQTLSHEDHRMYPILFRIFGLPIYSFGLMMAIAFMVALSLFGAEVKRRGQNEKLVNGVSMLALILGVAGSKLFSVFEDWDAFTRAPIKTLFSPSGLTFYGGFICATIGILIYLRKHKVPFRLFADMIAPIVFLAYGIGRIGCQLAGDGDYGIPTHQAWGMHYSGGTAKPTYVFEEYFARYPNERVAWQYDSLRAIKTGTDALGQTITRFDEVVTCQPTPIMETIAAVVCFLFLWSRRKRDERQPGKMFAMTVVLMGIERLLVEFMRINPLYFSLSMAQWISIGLIIYGIVAIARMKPAPIKST
ncbi:MAG: prolipoprotein diacylglyceryl transferase [Bacteroidetes bacterium]|nr:prolipoprotein diacylglyceryl transferase [Bacteroidota bacterium]